MTCKHIPYCLFPHPHGSSEIRRWNDAIALRQLGKGIGRALERECMGPLRVDDGEHLASDAEHEIAAPFDVLGDGGQAQAEGPNGVDAHREVVVQAFRPAMLQYEYAYQNNRQDGC